MILERGISPLHILNNFIYCDQQVRQICYNQIINRKVMIQEQQEDQMTQIALYYKYVEQQMEQKMRNLTTDTMQQIKNKIKRKQDKQSQDQNINLIEKERGKIIEEMKEHIKTCFHPHCKMVDQIILLYQLFPKNNQPKEDTLTLIVRPNVQGLPKIETDCFEGKKLNARMKQTHKLLAAI